jgi:hypothetical protein
VPGSGCYEAEHGHHGPVGRLAIFEGGQEGHVCMYVCKLLFLFKGAKAAKILATRRLSHRADAIRYNIPKAFGRWFIPLSLSASFSTGKTGQESGPRRKCRYNDFSELLGHLIVESFVVVLH